MKKESVFIIRTGEPDRHGQRPPSGDPIKVSGCMVIPRTGIEADTGGEVIIDGWQVIIPQGRPVPRATDRLRIRGQVHEVVGTPGDYFKKTIAITRKVGQSDAGS